MKGMKAKQISDLMSFTHLLQADGTFPSFSFVLWAGQERSLLFSEARDWFIQIESITSCEGSRLELVKRPLAKVWQVLILLLVFLISASDHDLLLLARVDISWTSISIIYPKSGPTSIIRCLLLKPILPAPPPCVRIIVVTVVITIRHIGCWINPIVGFVPAWTALMLNIVIRIEVTTIVMCWRLSNYLKWVHHLHLHSPKWGVHLHLVKRGVVMLMETIRLRVANHIHLPPCIVFEAHHAPHRLSSLGRIIDCSWFIYLTFHTILWKLVVWPIGDDVAVSIIK